MDGPTRSELALRRESRFGAVRRSFRILGTVLVAAGVLALAWTLTVWLWQDPVTALYTRFEQHRLSSALAREFADTRNLPRVTPKSSVSEERRAVAAAARRYRRSAHTGQAIGRIDVPRLGLQMVVVNGTDEATLRKGPGRDGRTFMPGEGELVYIAGHRTTYLAPFSHIERLRAGDRIKLEMPYATFVYAVTGHRIVAADDVSVLRSRGREELELQACHPRFFATHRYIADARLMRVDPRSGRPFAVHAR